MGLAGLGVNPHVLQLCRIVAFVASGAMGRVLQLLRSPSG